MYFIIPVTHKVIAAQITIATVPPHTYNKAVVDSRLRPLRRRKIEPQP